MLGRQDAFILPPLLKWIWWTVTLYACGASAIASPYEQLQEKIMGVLGFTLVVCYYTTMSDAYMALLPASAEHPDLWPSAFVSVNLIGPVLLMFAGCARATIQRGR